MRDINANRLDNTFQLYENNLVNKFQLVKRKDLELHGKTRLKNNFYSRPAIKV